MNASLTTDFLNARNKLSHRIADQRSSHASPTPFNGPVSESSRPPMALSQRALQCAAVNDFNSWSRQTGRTEFAHPTLPTDVIFRLCVSYLLRHHDETLTDEREQLASIQACYPFLRAACQAKLTETAQPVDSFGLGY